jgi:hypothetical protein
MDKVLNNIVTGNKMGVIDNMCVFSRVCKLRKVAISFVISVRLSRPYGKRRLPLDGVS